MRGFSSRFEASHFMVVRTDRMGDLILTAPLFDALKQHFPRARVSVLASQANAAIAGLHPAIDTVVVDAVEARDSGWRGTLTLARRLRQLRIDVILFANAKHRLAFGALLAGIPVRIGSARRGYSMLYTARLPRPGRPVREHETDWAVRLLQPLGVLGLAPASPWRITDFDRRAVDRLLTGEYAAAPIAAVHPANSGNALNASPAWYAMLSDTLAAAGYLVVLTGTEADRGLTTSIGARTRRSPLDLSGRLSVAELAALYMRCALAIGSSTGPTHLAAALGAPTVGLYAALEDQDRWLPRGAAVRVLRPAAGSRCATCAQLRCAHFNCMDLITAGEVLEGAAALGRADASRTAHGPPCTATN